MKKLIICIDGLGFDLISKENTPFLYKFGRENNLSVLKTFFAFTGIEYSFFMGNTPKENGIWLEFSKSKNSVFNNPLLKFFSFNKKLRTYLGALIQLSNKRTYISALHNIPAEKLKYFDSSAKEGLWKLPYFQEKAFSFYKWPFLITKSDYAYASRNTEKRKREKRKIIFKYESDDERLERLMKEGEKEVYYTQLMSIDKTIHKFGKNSKETREALFKIDKIIEKHLKKFLEENRNIEIIIWGDHGFADIKKYINLEGILPKRRDYLYFIAGTTASFWFKNTEVKKEITKILSKIKEGKILDLKAAEKYRIPFSKKYGDIVFYIKKGNYFFPNFYQREDREKFLAMHGYPDDKELDGFLITNVKEKVNKSLKINEIREIL
jgi:predicted AlkP superfamily pyrophosphatase or phosphodiesterase